MEENLKSIQNNKLYKEHFDLVKKANKITNITSIKDWDKAKILHVEDSLLPIHYILCFLKNNELNNIADLGSGAGYPGIPISIYLNSYNYNFDISLIESNQKKSNLLKNFIYQLKLKNTYVFNSRIENINKKFDIVVSRALSSISSILELSSPIIKIGGICICYKSDNIKEEIEEADKILNLLGFELLSNNLMSLSNSNKRRILIYKKQSEAKIKLPRKLGLAQKRPLK